LFLFIQDFSNFVLPIFLIFIYFELLTGNSTKRGFSELKTLIILGAVLVTITACDPGHSKIENTTPAEESAVVISGKMLDSMRRAQLVARYDTFPRINYRKHYIEDYNNYLDIKKEYGHPKKDRAAWRAFTTLNRKEFRFVRVGDSVIIPDMIHKDLRAYSLFPQFYYDGRHLDKIIFVSNKYQCYGAYEKGRLVRFAAVNSGKERTPTYPGRYALVWKQRVRHSSLDSTWIMPYTWNFHAQAGNAFHQFTMPGRPVSHSCIRQFMTDAEWLYEWGRGVRFDSSGHRIRLSGTPVIILDIFDFSRNKYGPWIDLKSNNDVEIELPEEPMNVEEAIIPICQIPLTSRRSLHNYERYKYGEDTLRARGIIREGVVLIETKNYNKLRREKKALAARKKAEEEKKKKSRIIEQSEAEKLDLRKIRTNLEELEDKKIRLKEKGEKAPGVSEESPPENN
jgi:hypothetical protein